MHDLSLVILRDCCLDAPFVTLIGSLHWLRCYAPMQMMNLMLC